MLIEFSVGNYKSFKETVTFSMVAAPLASPDTALDEDNTFPGDDDFRLLASAAIYGANASGKSNLVSAVRFMRNFVLNSSKETQAREEIPVERFRLSTETLGKPSYFQAVFLLHGKQHRYGFEVNSGRVVAEWLHNVPTIREATLFHRREDHIKVGGHFKEGKDLESKTRDNALFLSVVAQFNGRIALEILQWFRDFGVISGLEDDASLHETILQMEDASHQGRIQNFVKSLDLGIEAVHVDTSSELQEKLGLPDEQWKGLLRNGPGSGARVLRRTTTTHRAYDAHGKSVPGEAFSMEEHESAGTQKLFALAGPLMDALERGRILLIDELDARLHPLITRAIIGLFNSRQTNPNNAQLVFTTHDTNLLDNRMLRRDQIWFTEKDSHAATHLYSLAEYRVRGTDKFERDYIQGRYGGIPFIGDMSRILDRPHG